MCFFFHCSRPVGGMLDLAQTEMLDSPTQSNRECLDTYVHTYLCTYTHDTRTGRETLSCV